MFILRHKVRGSRPAFILKADFIKKALSAFMQILCTFSISLTLTASIQQVFIENRRCAYSVEGAGPKVKSLESQGNQNSQQNPVTSVGTCTLLLKSAVYFLPLGVCEGTKQTLPRETDLVLNENHQVKEKVKRAGTIFKYCDNYHPNYPTNTNLGDQLHPRV